MLASFIGGIYSLVILWDNLNFALSIFGKLAAACIMILIAYKFTGIKAYIKEVVIFFFVNLLFVGIMVGLWLIFKPKGVVINNSTVYFNISARVLLISAFIAYVISAVIIRIYNNKTARKELYSVTVFKNEHKIRFFAFADSGNNLKEPFRIFLLLLQRKSCLIISNAVGSYRFQQSEERGCLPRSSLIRLKSVHPWEMQKLMMCI